MADKFLRTLGAWSDSRIVWLGLALTFVFLIRLPVADVSVIDWDESIYFTMAQDVAGGGVPYKTTWDTKGPLLFLTLAPVVAVFGDSITALRIFTSICLLFSMLFVYLAAARLMSGLAAVVPALVYGLMFAVPGFGGLASNGELFMMLPVILAVLTYLDFRENGARHLIFLSGLFSAAAFLIKATAIFSVAVVPVFLIYDFFFRKPRRPCSSFTAATLYAAGFLAASGIVALYLGSNGALGAFLDTYFITNGKFVGAVPLEKAFVELVYYVHWLLLRNFELVTIAAVLCGILLLWSLFRKKTEVSPWAIVFTFVLAALSLLGVIWGRRMFPHYYLQMALPFALMVGLGVASTGLGTNYIKALMVLVAVIFLVQSPPARTASRIKAMDEDYYERSASYAVADYIKSNSGPGERILVIGGQPVVYFLSERRPAIKDFWWTEHHLIIYEILNLEETVPAALVGNKPLYVAYYDGRHEELRLGLDYLDRFVNDNYTLETRIEGYKIYRLAN
ncbi:MAG: glycosyltransferase family 39 protein [Candidatus Dadabacteria bacterium]|nr:glycosyltransferase family 39 protein [Candidatus Dadabacteria bacterium]